ncbi:MAG: hypothetical protein ACLQFR_23805 [Streptosporangiaceae bacterium]
MASLQAELPAESTHERADNAEQDGAEQADVVPTWHEQTRAISPTIRPTTISTTMNASMGREVPENWRNMRGWSVRPAPPGAWFGVGRGCALT